jgi:hypothetical protein
MPAHNFSVACEFVPLQILALAVFLRFAESGRPGFATAVSLVFFKSLIFVSGFQLLIECQSL